MLLMLFLGTGTGAGGGVASFLIGLCFSVTSGFLFTTFLAELGAATDFLADVSFFALERDPLFVTTGLAGVFFSNATGVFFAIPLTTLGAALAVFGKGPLGF